MLNAPQTTLPHEAVVRRGHETPASQLRHVLGSRTFRRVLDHERARADRSGQGFVVVTFVSREQDSWERELRTTSELLNSRLRSIDEIGWLSEGKLAVMLPYSSPEAGWKLADDLTAAYP